MVMCEKIRKARISEGLSQSDVAAATGMDVDTIICIEAGTMQPEISQQIRLSEYLDVSFFYLRHDECRDPHQLAGAQDAMIAFYKQFGDDALLRCEERFREELEKEGEA